MKYRPCPWQATDLTIWSLKPQRHIFLIAMYTRWHHHPHLRKYHLLFDTQPIMVPVSLLRSVL